MSHVFSRFIFILFRQIDIILMCRWYVCNITDVPIDKLQIGYHASYALGATHYLYMNAKFHLFSSQVKSCTFSVFMLVVFVFLVRVNYCKRTVVFYRNHPNHGELTYLDSTQRCFVA